jgi:glucose/arabinose dehydrogenase
VPVWPRPLPALLAVAAAALALSAAPARATSYVPSGFAETDLASGLNTPVNVAWAPDGHMFIAERQGIVMVHNPGDSAGINQQLLNISLHVNSAPDFSNDRGLLGIAVDKDFATNHFLYLLYTYDTNTNDDNTPKTSTLTRVTVNDTYTAASPETTILGSVHPSNGVCPAPSNSSDCIPSDGTSHSIGTVRVAPDGTLFVGSGTGGGFNFVDPLHLRAYNEQSLGGKVMHIQPNGKGVPGHPFCQSDNNLDDVCTKIWAEGFRNPFRFDLLPDGRIAVGDVGDFTWEELDLVGPGGNYGWPCYEGPAHDPQYASDSSTSAACAQQYAKEGTPSADLGAAFPFPHPDASFCQPDCSTVNGVTGETVIGGPEYTGDQYPLGFYHSLFLGNFMNSDSDQTGFIDRVSLDASGGVASVAPFATDWPQAGQTAGVDLETAPDGNLVYVSIAEGTNSKGVVREVKYLPGNDGPAVNAAESVASGIAPLAVAFTSNAHDPDGDPIHYDWDFGDGSVHSGAANPTHTYTTGGHRVVTLTVDDQRGKFATAALSVDVGPPPSGTKGTTAGSIRFHLSRNAGRDAKRGLISGNFTTSEQIKLMEVAIWRGRAGASLARSRCTWWSARHRRLATGTCRGTHFMHALLKHHGTHWTFTLRLHAPLPSGRYTLVVEAIPSGSHESNARRSKLTLRVPR